MPNSNNNRNNSYNEKNYLGNGKGIHKALGDAIRFARMKKGLSGKELAERMGVDPSTICKIEKNMSKPSFDLLRNIATELNMSMLDFIGPELPDKNKKGEPEDNHLVSRVSVIRADKRKILRLSKNGIEFQILSPDLQGAFEFAWVELNQGEGGSQSFRHRQGEESILVLSGSLRIQIEDTFYTLMAGDCITFDARLLHNFFNDGTCKVKWVYVVVPPTL